MAETSTLAIAIDSRGAEKNLRSVRTELSMLEGQGVESARSLQQSAKKIAKATAVAATAAAAAIGASAVAITAHTATISREMKELVRDAEAVGTSAENLSEWRYAARSMGIDVDKVGDIFKDVNDKIGDFVRTGGGEAADIFEQLGLNARDFIGLAPEQAILRISEAMDGLTTGEKTFFMESLADDASRLIPLLDNNAERFRKLAQEGRDWGAIVTNEQAEIAQGFSQLITDAERMAEGFKTQLGIGLAPTFEGMLDWLDEVADGFGGPAEAAQATARTIVEAMRDSVQGVQTLMSGLEGAYDFLLSIRELEAQGKAIGGTINNIIEGNDELPEGFMELQSIRAERARLASGQGFGSEAVSSLDSLLEHMERANTDAIPELSDTAVAAATNIGMLANSVQQTADAMATTRDAMVQQVQAGLVPTASQGAVPERATAPAAGLNLRSITPMSADQIRAGGVTSDAPSAMPAPKSRGSVHVTVTKDGNDVSGEVEGDDQFISRLANALSGVAAST